MNLSIEKKRKRGFSLLELTLAIAVFSLSSVAVVNLLIDSNLSTRLSVERTEALFYAKEGIEAVRSIRDNGWAGLENGPHGLDNSGGTWMFSSISDLINDKYTRVVSITASSTSSSTKDVSVNVNWELTSARIASTTLNTILTNWAVSI